MYGLRALINLRAKRRSDRGPTGVVRWSPRRRSIGKAGLSGEGNFEIVRRAVDCRRLFDTNCPRRPSRDRGPNGVGNHPIKLLTGEVKPDSGHIRLGKNLEIENLDQQRKTLDPTDTLARALTGGGDKVTINGETRHVIGYMKDFLFSPNQARTPVTVLSGGERGRIMLARAFAKPSNLLVLDEPTNDLDLETLDLLQELLAEYAGTVLLVSHDRDFLDRVVTSVVAGEGEAMDEYSGGYSDMLAQRGSDLIPEKQDTNRRGRKRMRTRACRVHRNRRRDDLQGPACARHAARPHRGIAGRDRDATQDACRS